MEELCLNDDFVDKLFDSGLFDDTHERFPVDCISDVRSMVRHSVAVQRSITYLDLSLCELSKFSSREKSKDELVNDLKFPCTEESCRKLIVPDRSVLYKFHLDVSNVLEMSVRNEEHKKIGEYYSDRIFQYALDLFADFDKNRDELLLLKEWCSSGVLVGKLSSKPKIHQDWLNNLISMSLDESNEKVRLIVQVCKLAKRLEFLKTLENRELFLDILYTEEADSTSVLEYLSTFNFKFNVNLTQPREKFSFLLYHANNAGFDLWGNRDPIQNSMAICEFEMTETLFQYRDSPKYRDDILDFCGGWFGLPRQMELELMVENESMNRVRLFLILQMQFIFHRDRLDGLKALQMVWRSIPYPFITIEELTLVLKATQELDRKEEIRTYITEVIGQELKERGLEPRKLQHYCRTVIRSALSNNWQLPTGIDKLKLPTSVKAYLKLEN